MSCARRLNAAAKYTCNCVLIEKMHAHNLALEFDHRNVHEEAFVPFRPCVDIADLQRQFSLDHGLQFLDQNVAKMAALAAVHRDIAHSIARRGDPRRHDRGEGTQALVLLQARSSGQHAETRASKRRKRGTGIAHSG